jgi:hypothetical protein
VVLLLITQLTAMKENVLPLITVEDGLDEVKCRVQCAKGEIWS